jgi:hypothetical protein
VLEISILLSSLYSKLSNNTVVFPQNGLLYGLVIFGKLFLINITEINRVSLPEVEKTV